MIASIWDMPLSTGMDVNQGPAGADTSSSLNSSVSCHRQLECSTGMTEGVSDSHNDIPPPLSTSTLPHQHASWLNPPPALISWSGLTGQLRQMARSCLVLKTQQVLRCQRPLHTSSLSLSHATANSGPPASPRHSPRERWGRLSWVCFVISMLQLWSELGQNLDYVYLKASPWLCVSAWGNYSSVSCPDRDDTVG